MSSGRQGREHEELAETMRLLERERPAPLPGFVDRLAATLGVASADRAELEETAGQLQDARPLPRPSFRGELGRWLSEPGPAPQRLRLRIAAFAGSGGALLLIVAIGLAGVGPLGS